MQTKLVNSKARRSWELRCRELAWGWLAGCHPPDYKERGSSDG